MTCACAATHTHRTKNLQQDEAGSAAAAEEGSKRGREMGKEKEEGSRAKSAL